MIKRVALIIYLIFCWYIPIVLDWQDTHNAKPVREYPRIDIAEAHSINDSKGKPGKPGYIRPNKLLDVVRWRDGMMEVGDGKWNYIYSDGRLVSKLPRVIFGIEGQGEYADPGLLDIGTP